MQAAKHFPSVVLTGPRRAGKTWLLRHAFPKADYFLLEDPSVVARLRSDPQGFLDEVRTPVILDEVQNVPEVFSLVRARIDRQPRRTGRWLLTGSQEAPLMQKVTESMAGRAAVLQLRPLSTCESEKVSLFLGGYPEVVARPGAARQWFSAYVQTYLERDVRAVTMVKDLATFRRFLALVASRHGQILNKTDLAAPLGVSVPTITQWLGVLETTAQILLVPTFYENVGKRLVKSPKMYLADSGLACHLLGIDSARELARSPFLGVLFEGFMAAEIMKAQINAGRRPEIYYFRDEQGLEVDFLVPGRQGAILLVECKATRTVVPSMAVPMQRLAQALKKKRPRGGAVEMSLVYQPSRTAIATTALAPGVQAVAWQTFVRALTRGFARILLLFLLIGLGWSPAWSESPAPSVHWGSTAFPDQYSTVTTGLTLNRFTPIDGLGNKYDSTVGNTLGFNLITLSWTQHWGGIFEGWSTNLTTGVSPTGDEPSQFFQNEVIHQLRQLPAVPTVAPRKETDVMIDGSLTRWFSLDGPKVVFVGGGFSVGTIYQQGFLRAGIRRLQISPTLYSGSWGDVSVRASTLGRISYQDNGAVLHAVRQTAGLVQPAIAFGQYRTNSKGETIPTWEVEFAVMWDSGIFVNTTGQSQKMFAWSLALSGGPLRFETWNDSMGKLAERDYGPTYGVSLTLDLLRSWNQIACMTGNPQWMPL